MQISQATIDDAEQILTLQKLAYRSEAERYNNYDIPPLRQTIDEIKEQFKSHIFLKAVSEGKIIGTVRAYKKTGTCYVGRLAVHPDMQNQGIGTALMREIEKLYSPRRYELFVGSKSDKNIHLYQKLGYNVYKTDQYVKRKARKGGRFYFLIERKLSGKQIYNIVADTAIGINVRKKDNIIQASSILVFVIVGAVIAILAFGTHKSLTDPNRLAQGIVGGLVGLIAGLILSGAIIMVVRFIMHVLGKHD